jgi:hypothetical protein
MESARRRLQRPESRRELLRWIALASVRGRATREQLRENPAGGTGVEAFRIRLHRRVLSWDQCDKQADCRR